MSYNKPTKYKILDMKNNQQLINDEMVIVKVPHETAEPKITIAMVMEKLTEFMNKQEKFNERIELTLNEHTKRFDKLENEVKGINIRIDNLVKMNNLKE